MQGGAEEASGLDVPSVRLQCRSLPAGHDRPEVEELWRDEPKHRSDLATRAATAGPDVAREFEDGKRWVPFIEVRKGRAAAFIEGIKVLLGPLNRPICYHSCTWPMSGAVEPPSP